MGTCFLLDRLLRDSLRSFDLPGPRPPLFSMRCVQKGRDCAAVVLPRRRPASPLEVFLVVLRGDKLERDPNKGLNLLALDEFNRGFHRPPALTLAVLEDGHIQIALLHLSERIRSCVNTRDDNFLGILASLLEREDRSDGHFVVVCDNGIDLCSRQPTSCS